MTGLLRGWLMNESGYPAAWMPEIKRILPKQHINVVAAGAGVTAMKEDYGRSLQILLCVCSLVLLIACANSANLLLARGMARRSETSIRLAVGASRSRIMLQSLTESVLLAIGGGLAGLLVAYGAGRLLLYLAFRSSHSLAISSAPSWPVLGFALALSLVTGVLFGTAPAWFATLTNPVEALRGANRSTRDSSSFSRNALLVIQATLSVVLIAGAGMLARSLRNLEKQDLGLETRNRMLVEEKSPPASYTAEHLDALYRDLQERLRHLPHAEQAELALYNPFTDNWGEAVFVEGHPAGNISADIGASWDRVTPNYTKALGQKLVRGRLFTEADRGSSLPVALVNETFVRKFMQHDDALQKRFGLDLPENARDFRVVGVVSDAKYFQPDKPPRPMFFLPLAQRKIYRSEFLETVEQRSHYIDGALLVTSATTGIMEPLIRQAFSAADPNLSVISVRTLADQVAFNFDQQRAVAGLAGLFGVVALILAAIGLYGVTAYAVAQRTSEIGVRMALGASRPDVLRLILGSAFRKVALGLLLGVPLAIGAGRMIAAQLYGVTSWDPAALAIAISSLSVCAFLAAIIPANRAASLDPMRALRTE